MIEFGDARGHPFLPDVISESIGGITHANIEQVLEMYDQPNHVLIGAFDHQHLIGVIGLGLENSITIKHISVIKERRMQGIGGRLVRYAIKQFPGKSIIAETDDEAVEFYKSLGFACEAFEGKYNIRYKCVLKFA